jgi:2-dehydropantoate 2-reductase
MSARRYVVLGCGAVGGLYGARLAAAGHEVGFVARSDVDVLRRDGLRVDSVDGDVLLPGGSFAASADPADLGLADVVVVAVKTTANGALADLLGPVVGPSTIVAVFQNGLGVEAVADVAAPGAAAVVGGLCFVCSAKPGPGHVVHADYGAVTVAPYRGGLAAAEAVADDLVGSGSIAEATADLTTARWRKLLWNIPFNGLTALLDVGTDALLADPAGRARVEALMREVVAGGAACGAALTLADVDDMVAKTEAMVPYRASMAVDLAAGRPLELDAIYAAPLRAAAEADSAMPAVEQLLAELRLCDEDRRGRAAPTS